MSYATVGLRPVRAVQRFRRASTVLFVGSSLTLSLDPAVMSILVAGLLLHLLKFRMHVSDKFRHVTLSCSSDPSSGVQPAHCYRPHASAGRFHPNRFWSLRFGFIDLVSSR